MASYVLVHGAWHGGWMHGLLADQPFTLTYVLASAPSHPHDIMVTRPDELTSILTSKSAQELMTPDGKQRMRDEIKARVNKAFERITPDPKERQEVLAVYFSDFIIQ